jgi:hypothetical protein
VQRGDRDHRCAASYLTGTDKRDGKQPVTYCKIKDCYALQTMTDQPLPAPRHVPSWRRLFSFGIMFAMLFGGIWALVGGIITVVFIAIGGGPWVDWGLDQRGMVAQAQITGSSGTSARVNHRPVRRYSISFRDGSNEERKAEVSTSRPIVGDSIEIEYDPQNASLVRIKGGHASIFGPFFLLPGIFLLVGSTIFAIGGGRLLGRRRVYRDGVAALATVTGSRPTSGRINRRRVHRVEYQFEGPHGPEHGSYTTVTPDERGTELWILYDREDPRKSLPA